MKTLPLLLPLFCAAVASGDDSAAVANVPAQGRWSIARGWHKAWPADWSHASETETERVGQWTIYRGRIEWPEGTWLLEDAERSAGDGTIECRRRWEWTGETTVEPVTLSVRRHVSCDEARPFLPGISYYDNPAGQSVDDTRIPVIGTEQGSRAFYEEHRFPLPLAAIEASREGKLMGAALHTVPSPLKQGNYDDQWWSLGIGQTDQGIELALLSGAVASNGQDGIIKANQKSFIRYADGWLGVQPGEIIEKTFFVQTYDVSRRGDGFRHALWKSVELSDPFDLTGFPPVQEIIALKFHDTQTRWHEDKQFAGIDAFPDTGGRVRAWIDLGWAGQSEAAAYPLLLLGESFDVADHDTMASRLLDFIATSPFNRDGFSIRYDFAAHQWLPRRNPLSQAQAMLNMLNAVRIVRRDRSIDVTKIEKFLMRACDLHARRVLDEEWRPVSTNEAFLIAPLAQASVLFGGPAYLEAARKAANHYGDRHLSMDEPYWGGTLDARCEDKEGAWAALQGFLAMYEVTQEPKYLDWAQHAADVVISYVYVWDVPLPPGRLSDHAFKSRGWTSVSVQNMHLDVYGVLCAPAIWRLGELTDRQEYRDMARLMLIACGQLVDPTGSQGEQLHQTNYAQHYDVTDLRGVRGDYIESWNVYWISAHFLTAAAQFEEMNVDWHHW